MHMPSSTELAHAPPTELGSPRTKLVYLYLANNGRTTVSDLQRTLDMPKTTLLPILQRLQDEELLDRTDDGLAVR